MNVRYLIGGILVIVGLSGLFGVDVGRFIGPIILIWLGWMLLSKPGKGEIRKMQRESVDKDVLNDVQVFSGTEKIVESNNFQGGKLVTVFGNTEVDMTGVKTRESEIDMEVTAVFGATKLRVPEGWKVENNITAIAGGVDKKLGKTTTKGVTLKLTGAVVLGGVEISS